MTARLKEIVEKQTLMLAKRLEERKIKLELTDNAKALIAVEGFDPVYGARPIKRTIQKQILDPLAQKVLTGEFKEGDTVVVDAQDGNVFWEKAGRRGKTRQLTYENTAERPTPVARAAGRAY